MTRPILLVCGALSSLLYLGIDVLGGMRYEGYSYVSQTVSELSAIGAPSRPFLVPLSFAYSVLAGAFGWGVWRSAGRNRALRVVGGLLIAYGVLGLAWPFAPMQMRGNEIATTDVLHIALSTVTVLLILPVLGFGAAALGPRFRLYSMATILVLVVFGILTGLAAPRIALNLPTPWIGMHERIMLYAFILWIGVLAVALLRGSGPRGDEEGHRDVGRGVD